MASNTGAGPETGRLKTGDIVRIIDDEEKIKNLQDNHGGYNNKMKHYLGKVGQVIKVDSDGDLYVKFGSRWFVYNPMCCTPAPGEKIYERSDDDDDDSENVTINQSDLHSALMMMILSGLGETMSESMSLPVLFAATVKGDINMVRRVLNNSPELVNALHHDLTALCIASHQGHREIVLELLNKGADINKVDKLGNTPLIGSLAGNEPTIAKLLVEKGADVTVTNNDGRTALHCASLADYSSLVEIIIGKGCDVNSQDSEGDTALHDAIFKGNNDSIAVLCRHTYDAGIVNKKGFNVLQWASLRNQAFAVDKILDKHKSLVNAKKSDGFTALHIAAVNDHTDCAKVLIEKGNAEINSKDLDGHTPLLLAAIEGKLEVLQLLIGKNADVNMVDGKKCTPLHACCIGRTSQGGAEQMLARMMGLSFSSDSNTENRIKVARCLIENGARTDLKNVNGDTPIECCKDDNMKRTLSEFIRQRQGGGSAEFSGTGTGAAAAPETIGELLGIRLPCKRCMSKPATITLLPCAHKCVCRECALQANRCPACQQDIHRRVATRGNPTENPECCVQ